MRDDITGERARRAAPTDPQGACGHGRAAGMADVAAQYRRAGGELLQGSRAGDRRGDGERARTVEDEGGVVGDGAGAERAGRAACADAQRAAGNRRGAGGGVATAEGDRAAGRIDRERAGTGDRSTEGRAQSREDERASSGGIESMQGAASRGVAPRGNGAARTRGRAEVADDDDAGAAGAAY